MTRISRQSLKCPKCNTSFSVTYFASINTWIDPILTKDFLEEKMFLYSCPSCNQSIRLVTTIIINTSKGMFTISTDATKEERKELYKEYGLVNEDGNFGNPRDDWMLHQFAKMKAPDDTKKQKRRQDKILEEIHKKLFLYKEKLNTKSPLNEVEEKEFNELHDRWEQESSKEETYLHHPKTKELSSNTSILFHRLWEDLLSLKNELNKLK